MSAIQRSRRRTPVTNAAAAAPAITSLAPAVALDVSTPALRTSIEAILRDAQIRMAGAESIAGASVVIVEAADVAETLARVRRASPMDAAIIVLSNEITSRDYAGAFAFLNIPPDAAKARTIIDAACASLIETNVVDAEFMAAIGRVCAGIHHELAGPLSVASLNFTLIERECKRVIAAEQAIAPVLLSALKDTVSELESARDLLLQMRGLVRQGPAELVEVDLAETAQKIGTSLNEEAPPKLSIEIDAGAPVIGHGDPSLVSQIVTQFVTNAIQAMSDLPSSRLRIRAFRDGAHAVIAVHDNGPGIATDLHRVVFEPFVTSRRGDGRAGLGLALSRERAAQMRGDILVRSAHGRGAVFSLRLQGV